MNPSFYSFPVQASTYAAHFDLLWWALVAVSTFGLLLVGALVFFFGIKYRRRPDSPQYTQDVESNKLELSWTLGSTVIFVGFFAWSSYYYIHTQVPPKNAMEIMVVGKQWMWKFEHPNGRREINELHVPIGRPIRMSMISQDVIHSVGIPAFRLKQDVLPGRYTSLWFQATKTGVFHLFCNQYCGTKHAEMVGTVIAMEPNAYAQWVSGASSTASPAAEGRKLFEYYGCIACHDPGAAQRAPSLDGVYGSKVQLEGGGTVVANDDYVRESILDPGAKIVKSFQNIMPSFRGRVSEEQLMSLLAYIKSLGNQK